MSDDAKKNAFLLLYQRLDSVFFLNRAVEVLQMAFLRFFLVFTAGSCLVAYLSYQAVTSLTSLCVTANPITMIIATQNCISAIAECFDNAHELVLCQVCPSAIVQYLICNRRTNSMCPKFKALTHPNVGT